MKYLGKSFTFPVAVDLNPLQWDYSTLTKAEYMERYHVTGEEYDGLMEKMYD